MVRPAFIKLGGSVLTNKSEEDSVRRPQMRRLVGEIARAGVPSVLFHGAGSCGHPQAYRAGIGTRFVRAPDVAHTLTTVGGLTADVVTTADRAGLKPFPVPLHIAAQCVDGAIEAPVEYVQQLVTDGCTPVIPGTLVQDTQKGWRVVSADEWMEVFIALNPRLAVFVIDVDIGRDGPGGPALATIGADELERVALSSGPGSDVTGRLAGKLRHALRLATHCPVLLVNGTVRGRLQDLLKGKDVPATRVV